MKTILLIQNKKKREHKYLSLIKAKIEENSSYSVYIVNRSPTKELIKSVYKNKPYSILTFPFTAKDSSLIFYILKFLYGFRLVTLRTEGIVDYKLKMFLKWHVGIENYGKRLVDLEIFWGKKQMNIIGKILLGQNKISSKKRLTTIGNPMFEYSKDTEYNNKIILFATGFYIGNYYKDDLIYAKDIPSEDIDFTLEVAKKTREFRKNLMLIIDKYSQVTDYKIYVKIHPIERMSDYNFNNYKIKVYQNKPINELIKVCDYFFHYGSTTALDSYILKKPTFFFYQNNLKNYFSDLGWPNKKNIEIEELYDFLYNKKFEKYKFEETDQIKRVLKDQINYSYEKLYTPSKEIAKMLLEKSEPQRIAIYDYFLIRAFFKLLFSIIIFRRNI